MTDLQKIREKRAILALERAALEEMDAELAIAEKVLAGMEGEAPPVSVVSPTPPPPVAVNVTRREMVMKALSGTKVWMTSAEINQEIGILYGAPLKGSSLYPLLTVLKKERVLSRAGDKLAIKRRAEGGSSVAN